MFILAGSGKVKLQKHKERVQFDKTVRDNFVRTIPLSRVKALTQNFSDDLVIGRGGFGIVYKATSPSGEILAIKRAIMKQDSHHFQEFQKEVNIH